MKLFWKIFLSVLFPFIVAITIITLLISGQRIGDTKKYILEQNRMLGDLVALQVERGFVISSWPFESLEKLVHLQDFSFWWVVTEDNSIYLAHDVKYMGTSLSSYFSEIPQVNREGTVFKPPHKDLVVFIKHLHNDNKVWTFWLGFSTQRIASIQREIAILTFALFLINLAVIAGIVYVIVRIYTKRIQLVATGASKIGKGNLHYRVHLKTNDELGDLAISFNTMAESLEKITVSRDYLNIILESMLDSLIVTDIDGTIQSVNNTAINLLEYEEQELLGKPFDFILHTVEQKTPDTIPFLLKLVQSGQLNLETTYRSKSNIVIPVLLNAAIVQEKNTGKYWIVCTAKDITKLKDIEQALIGKTDELTRSNNELEHFAYIASHDLQEPLRKINTFGDLLQGKFASNLGEQGNDYLNRMQKAAHRMSALISGLLTYSRINSQANPFINVDLNEVLKDVLTDLDSRIANTRAKITSDQLPCIEADLLQMQQLLQNLVSNAIKFHKPDENPSVHITSIPDNKTPPSWCEIRFNDNGIGIEKKYHDQIFGIFQRLHGRSEYEGSGIGLAVCKGIVKRHQGTIHIESTVGKGTTFIIRLPLKQVPQS